MERILTIIKKEFIHLFRDPRMIVMLLFIPVFQTLIFGLVVNTNITKVNISIFDMDKSTESREIINRLTSSDYFQIYAVRNDLKEMENDINKGNSRAGLIIPDKFTENHNKPFYSSNLELVIDGTDSNTSSLIVKYLNSILKKYIENSISINKKIPQIDLQTKAFYNQNLISRFFFVPGVVALIVTVIITLLSSMAIVREKETGTIEQIMVTPVKNYEFILGKTIPFAIIGYIDISLAVAVGKFAFAIPFRGSLITLYLGSTLYLTAMLGIGLIISTISNTQQEAMMTSFLFIFPIILLSGFIFPVFNMPEMIKMLTYLNPLRFFLVITRGVFLKGADIKILYKEFAILFIHSVIVLFIAINRFKKKIS